MAQNNLYKLKEQLKMKKMFLKRKTFIIPLCFLLAGYIGTVMLLSSSSVKQDLETFKTKSRRAPLNTIQSTSEFKGKSIKKDPLSELKAKLKQGMTIEEMEKELLNIKHLPRKYRYDAFSAILLSWGEKAGVEAMDHMDKIDDWKSLGFRKKNAKLLLLNNTLVKMDPEAAAQYYIDHKEELTFERMWSQTPLEAIVAHWTHKSPEKTWNWIASLSKKEQTVARSQFIRELKESFPDLVGQYLPQFSPNEIPESILKRLIADSREMVEPWAHSHGSEEVLQKIKQQELVTSLRLDPEAFKKEWESLPLAEREKMFSRDLMEALVATQGYANTSNWCLTQQDMTELKTDEFGNCFNELFYNLKNNDPVEMKAWIDTLPEGKIKERFLSSYVSGSPSVHYEETVKLAESLKGKYYIKKAWNDWKKNDPEAAEKWLEKSSYTPKEKEDLRETRKEFPFPSFAGGTRTIYKNSD